MFFRFKNYLKCFVFLLPRKTVKRSFPFSWDWGPAYPSMGIWRPIRIEAFDSVVVKYIKWNTRFSDGSWSVEVNKS